MVYLFLVFGWWRLLRERSQRSELVNGNLPSVHQGVHTCSSEDFIYCAIRVGEPLALISCYQVEPGNEGLEAPPLGWCKTSIIYKPFLSKHRLALANNAVLSLESSEYKEKRLLANKRLTKKNIYKT